MFELVFVPHVFCVNHGVMRWGKDMGWMKEDLKPTFFKAALNSCSFAILPCPVGDLLSIAHLKVFSGLEKQIEEIMPFKVRQFYFLLFD